MTLYLLFTGIGVLAYVGVAAAMTGGLTSTHVAFAFGFTAVVILWAFDAGAVLLSVSRYAYTWVLLVTIALCVAIAIAANGPVKVSMRSTPVCRGCQLRCADRR